MQLQRRRHDRNDGTPNSTVMNLIKVHHPLQFCIPHKGIAPKTDAVLFFR
ncbi:hypothetical protein QNH14_01305 [Apirhabdus apintestini]|nr:hypothetical protein QNH14_01305 [Enterobacteriaceae bacterium CA-0114]